MVQEPILGKQEITMDINELTIDEKYKSYIKKAHQKDQNWF